MNLGIKTKNRGVSEQSSENLMAEVRKMPEKGEGKCAVCGEAITNPICPECLQNEIEQWIDGFKPSAAKRIKGYSWGFDTYRHDTVKCVVCGNNMSICAHCFCKDVFELVEKELGELAEDFLYSFNFDLLIEAG